MTESTVPLIVTNYLAKLDTAMIGVPDATAQDIRAGITEELTGLDAATAAIRIEQLGDPFFIAAEARGSAGESEHTAQPTARPTSQPANVLASDASSRYENTGYILLASLLVALGGLVIPVLGWAAGIVMVSVSSIWTRFEKWAATLVSLCAIIVTSGIIAVVAATERAARDAAQTRATHPAGFQGPTIEDFNPLIPAWFDILWSSGLVFILVNFVVGLTLLVRAQRRRDSAQHP